MKILEDASTAPKWDSETLVQLVDAIQASIPDITIDWDLGAGEGWARLSLGLDLCGLIRAPTTARPSLRFAFLNRRCQILCAVRVLLVANNADIVEVDDFDELKLSARWEDLEIFIDGPMPPAHVFDPTNFAPNDLVFVSE